MPTESNTVTGQRSILLDDGRHVPVVALDGNGAAAAAVTPTQTLVTLAAGVSQTLIAANAARRYLAFANVGAGPMTVAPGAVTVTAGQGMNYAAGEAPAYQGGGQAFEGSAVATSAFSAVSAAGTTVCIWEG